MLVPYAKQWHQLWSIRLLILSMVLDAVAAYFSYLDFLFPAKWMFGLGFLVQMAAGVARIVAQPKVHEDTHPES